MDHDAQNSPVGAWLQFLAGPLAGQTIPLTKRVVTLGREPSNDILINEPSVSRAHARLIMDGPAWRIEKVAAGNTVIINQQPLVQATIANNDVIGLGTRCAFRFICDAARAASLAERQMVEPTVLAGGGQLPPPLPFGRSLEPPPGPSFFPPRQERMGPFQPQGTGFSSQRWPPFPSFSSQRAQPAHSHRALVIGLLIFVAVVVAFAGMAALVSRIPPSPFGPVIGSQPGSIIGTVLTSQGRPVQDAFIHIEGVGNAGERVAYNTQTGADGTYALKVPDGTYTVDATVHVTYLGASWTLPLYPDDNSIGSMDSENGIVKNFTWKLTGPMVGENDPTNPSTYYGGYVMATVLYPPPPDGTTLRFTFTPVGPLADGSTIAAIVQEKQIQGGFLPNHGYLVDIPLGEYTLTGTQTIPGGQTTPLFMTPGTIIGSGAGATPSLSLDIQFHPSHSVGAGNGIDPAQITILPGTGQ